MKGTTMTKYQAFCKKHQIPILLVSIPIAAAAVAIAVSQVLTHK